MIDILRKASNDVTMFSRIDEIRQLWR